MPSIRNPLSLNSSSSSASSKQGFRDHLLDILYSSIYAVLLAQPFL